MSAAKGRGRVDGTDKDDRESDGRKNHINKDYPLEEAECLVAKNPILKDYTPLE
mgnify:CR=1 FL=1